MSDISDVKPAASSGDSLSAEAITALECGRNVEAIKIVREQQHIGLKEAKEIVDAYITQNPGIPLKREGNTGKTFIMAVAVVLIFGVYKYFAG